MPTLTVIAGPNGSGKSTITRYLDFEGKDRLLDPDAIARRIDPVDPGRAAVTAGREAIRRTREYIATGVSFGIETTLSSDGMVATMRQALEAGFSIHISYICLGDPELNVQRVRELVRQGGHNVPEVDIRRRYERSLQILPGALRIAHEASVFENANDEPILFLKIRNGEVAWLAPDAPAWVTNAVEALTAN